LEGVAATSVEDLFGTGDLETRDGRPGGRSPQSLGLLFRSSGEGEGEEALMKGVPIAEEYPLVLAGPPLPFSRDNGNSFVESFLSLLGMTPGASPGRT
jgi:hypothetical protein